MFHVANCYITSRRIYYHTRFFKKTASTGIHIDTYITPATLNFHVVLGSAERHEQKLLFFFEGRQTHNSEYNIELGDGAPWRLRHDVYFPMMFFIIWLCS